jgi:hypothetical protein
LIWQETLRSALQQGNQGRLTLRPAGDTLKQVATGIAGQMMQENLGPALLMRGGTM